ncbi:MAG: hypothetical protein SFX18_01975 [Pirellulales bacterium]|nr:hypothetical protein [Pirellulales bacterium]
MKKASLLLAILTLVASPAWAGNHNNNKQQNSSPKFAKQQQFQSSPKFQALLGGGHGSSSHNHASNKKPLLAQGITTKNLLSNRPFNLPHGSAGLGKQIPPKNAKPFSTHLNPQPLQSQGITLQNLKPNRPNMLKGTEGPNNTLPVVVSNPVAAKPGYVWTGNHWVRAKAPAGGAGNGNAPQVDPLSNFTTMANNPPPRIRVPVQDPPKPGRPMGGRPQHGTSANGGLTVNWQPGSQRPADVVGVGASPIDQFFSAVGGSLGSDFKPGKLTRPTVVDHR